MRRETGTILERARYTPPILGFYGGEPGELQGCFLVRGPCGDDLKIVASDGQDPISQGWEHVSISKKRNPPNWQEMCFVKDLFWAPEECVVQFHPAESDYVNNSVNCLHLWRHNSIEFPKPPSFMVGIKEEGVLTKARAQELAAALMLGGRRP